MFGIERLEHAFNTTLSVVNFRGGFDTFTFRQGFQHEFELSNADKNEILDYLKTKAPQGGSIFQAVKAQIDTQEFLSTDYYMNPFPRKFFGAYSPVIHKTMGGLMAMSLQNKEEIA